MGSPSLCGAELLMCSTEHGVKTVTKPHAGNNVHWSPHPTSLLTWVTNQRTAAQRSRAHETNRLERCSHFCPSGRHSHHERHVFLPL
ncbi:unnamed protein product [Discosporangium mesarthrocarpum]